MWRLNACLCLISPVPVSLNRFFAPDLVFILGMASRVVLGRCMHRPALFLLLRDHEHDHALAFQLGHALHHPHILQVLGELQQQDLPTFLEDDAATAEEHECLQLVPFLQEFARVLQLEVHVVLIGVGPEADLLHFHGGLLGLDLLLLLLEVVEELLVLDDAAYDGHRRCADLHQVQALLLRHAQGLAEGIHALFHVIPHQTHLVHPEDLVVDPVRVFLDDATAVGTTLTTAAGTGTTGTIGGACHLWGFGSCSAHKPPSCAVTRACTRSVNAFTGMVPRSPWPCSRTETVPSAASFSPMMSMNGVLASSASRILRPIFSFLSSTEARISES